MKFHLTILGVVLLANFCRAAADGLPSAVQQRLSDEYPGWRIATVNPSVWQLVKNHHPCLVRSDFDRDGKPDWAVQIALVSPGEEEQFVTVFLTRDDGYEESIVESRGLDPSVYLSSRQKDVEEMASGKTAISRRSELIVKGGPLGDSIYYWEGGQFRESPPDPTLVPGETLTLPLPEEIHE